MAKIIANLNFMTVGELRELIKDFDDSVEISVWDNSGLVDTVEIEINKHEDTIDINIEVEEPRY